MAIVINSPFHLVENCFLFADNANLEKKIGILKYLYHAHNELLKI